MREARFRSCIVCVLTSSFAKTIASFAGGTGGVGADITTRIGDALDVPCIVWSFSEVSISRCCSV